MSLPLRIALWLLALASLLPSASFAQSLKVEVHTDVVLLSHEGSFVDPSLASMKATFEKEGFAFSSYRRLAEQQLTLELNKAFEMTMPDKQKEKATLTLQSIKKGSALIDVKIGALHTTYTLGRKGSVYINYGSEDGELMLVLSPATTQHARRLEGASRPDPQAP